MIIQLNTDKNIEGREGLEAYVSGEISKTLKHFSDHITRIEVHLADVNADKGGADDIQCKIEARVKGMQPLMADSKNASKERAVADAADKMRAVLSSKLGKMFEK